MNATTYAVNFEAAVAAADLDAEIAVYTADLSRPDFIYYSCVANGFVFGAATTVYQTYTAADAARSAPIPTPTPMPGPGDFDDGDSALCTNCGIDICAACNVRWHRGRGLLVARAPRPTPPPTPAEIDDGDSTLCADCRQPADDRCWSCRIDLCAGCNDRFHRHERLLPIRRNGAAFFDRQRAVAAFRTSTIETYLLGARAAAAELHGDIGDAAYSERVQRGVDELFN